MKAEMARACFAGAGRLSGENQNHTGTATISSQDTEVRHPAHGDIGVAPPGVGLISPTGTSANFGRVRAARRRARGSFPKHRKHAHPRHVPRGVPWTVGYNSA